jgi:hypothetical protein
MLESKSKGTVYRQDYPEDSRSEDSIRVLLLVNALKQKKPEMYRHILGLMKAMLKE